MAVTPGGPEGLSGDKKRLQQRADFFATGTGSREKREDVEAFDETIESVTKTVKVAEQDEDAEKKSRELHDYQETSAKGEAERRGTRSSNPNLLGLVTLPGVSGPNLAIGDTPRSESKGRSGGVGQAEGADGPSLSPEVLNKLKLAGLKSPITNLDDPRLTREPDKLRNDYVLSLTNHDRVYVWSQNDCHQILTIGMNETKVESAAGTVVETLIRKGKVDQKQVVSRAEPEEFRELTE